MNKKEEKKEKEKQLFELMTSCNRLDDKKLEEVWKEIESLQEEKDNLE